MNVVFAAEFEVFNECFFRVWAAKWIMGARQQDSSDLIPRMRGIELQECLFVALHRFRRQRVDTIERYEDGFRLGTCLDVREEPCIEWAANQDTVARFTGAETEVIDSTACSITDAYVACRDFSKWSELFVHELCHSLFKLVGPSGAIAVGEMPGVDIEILVNVGGDFIAHELVFGDGKGDDTVRVGGWGIGVVKTVRADFAESAADEVGCCPW